MKDSPCFQGRLLKHLVLDLAINFSSTLFNIESVSLSASFSTHDHFASLIFESLQLSWVLLKFEMPQLLLLLAFGVSVEDFKQILAFIDLSVSISVDDFSKILHESEISSHSVSESSNLAEFRYQSDLIASFSVFVNQ